ncbi:MAG: NAD(P)-dependent oxidoreductase [Deltaproteobacteria bacterium]|nr:NAD(P)-dependent oxidoreductase [Deltaproteobacteria bacterium]
MSGTEERSESGRGAKTAGGGGGGGGTLKGRTLVITGASRGIGKAMALRAARDGAKIAILAKTVEAHPTLPGTVFTAAEEIEAAGGEALAVGCDVRFEDQVKAAVATIVERFGGIDILINNASAISLTNTEQTSMKKFDLMHQVNVRGTFLATQACLPHLSLSTNPHVLNNSPPLNMNVRWFKDHTAYTMSKYGMSMCVLGMAEEFRALGIAVNALWPKTAIATAAMRMLGGDDALDHCRKPEIMADAAHAILVRPSRACTGHFFIDEEVLRAEGVSDFAPYAVSPGKPLFPDYFLDA